MNIRTVQEPTPEGRLAAIARDEMYRHVDAKVSRLPDYADFRTAFRNQMRIEILHARISEASLMPDNSARVTELIRELACLLIST